jgi:hypothetical protein
MLPLGSPAAKARRTLTAAALLLLAGLVIAGIWSATEAMRAAAEIGRSSATLVELAKLRVALAETRVETTGIEQNADRRPTHRERQIARLAQRQERLAPGASDSLALLLHARAAADETEVPRLNAELERHVRLRTSAESRRLDRAVERLETRALQTLFMHLTVGLLALGALGVALRHRD